MNAKSLVILQCQNATIPNVQLAYVNNHIDRNGVFLTLLWALLLGLTGCVGHDINEREWIAEEIQHFDVARRIPNWELNLVDTTLRVSSPDAIKQLVQIRQSEKNCSINYPRKIWGCRLTVHFVDHIELEMEVLKTRNNGCLVIHCPRCFGFKKVTCNDGLCEFLEMFKETREDGVPMMDGDGME